MHQPLILHTDWSRSWGGQEIRTLTELREMKKMGLLIAFILATSIVSAVQLIQVEPYESKNLEQLTSSVPTDISGLQRTYLYCTWDLRLYGIFYGFG